MSPAAVTFVEKAASLELSIRLGGDRKALETELVTMWEALSPEDRKACEGKYGHRPRHVLYEPLDTPSLPKAVWQR